MKVDKQKLTKLLAVKTGLDPEVVKEQLDELVTRIKATAEKGKALEIKGFGMFFFSKDDVLTFEPSEDLQTEVNYKYAGMEPVEIKKPHGGPETSVREKESDSDEIPVSEEAADLNPDKEEAPGAGRTAGAEPGKSAKFRGKKRDPEESGKDSEKTKDNSLKRRSGSRKVHRPKKRENAAVTVVTAVVVILVIISGLIIVLDREFMGDIFGGGTTQEVAQMNSGQHEAVQENVPDRAAAGLEEEADQEAGSEESEQAGREQPVPPVIEEAEVPESPDFGLHGEVQDLEEHYYSIVLHSVRGEDRAEEIRGELHDEGYRSLLTSVNNEEMGVMWRVGIGQFESISDAQEAASGLPEVYRDNHFIGIVR